MPITTADLRKKRETLLQDAGAILAAAAADERDALKDEEHAKWSELMGEAERLATHIEARDRQERLESELRTTEEPRSGRPDPDPERRVDPRDSRTALTRKRFDDETREEALRAWFLAGTESPLSDDQRNTAKRVGLDLNSRMLTVNLSREPMRSLRDRATWQYRAQGLGTTAGGYTVSDEMMRAIEVALLQFGGMRQVSTVLRTTTGAALPIPTANDTAQVGAILGENTQASPQDVTFGQVVLDAFKYSSKLILVSVELLQDTSINLGAFLGSALGERIGRIQNTHFTTGDHSSKPNGIVPAATVGYTCANSTSQVTAVKYESLVSLEHSVDPAYRSGASFMMNDSSIAKIKQILDGSNRPLWMGSDAGIAGGFPGTLLGYPVIPNNDVAAMGVSAKSIIFGQLSKYLIRDVTGITLLRLDERYADYHQVAFLAFQRSDGDLLDAGTHPVKVLVNAAS